MSLSERKLFMNRIIRC